jgi:hypothetical protein
MYDAGTIEGVYVFAGSVLADMNRSLWASWDLPGHLDAALQPWLGSATVTVVDRHTLLPIAGALVPCAGHASVLAKTFELTESIPRSCDELSPTHGVQ